MAIDRTPTATQFSGSSVFAHGNAGVAEPTDVEPKDDESSENVASVQYMLHLFSQRYPAAYAALNLTPAIIAGQISYDEASNSVFLPVFGADHAQTQAALAAWRSFITFFHDNTTDQEYDLELYRPKQ